MSRYRAVCLLFVLASAACRPATDTGSRRLEDLCAEIEIREQYLDFYWDDLRGHRPEIWAEALATCTETCPGAVNCAPVLSVASWYEHSAVTTDPIKTDPIKTDPIKTDHMKTGPTGPMTIDP